MTVPKVLIEKAGIARSVHHDHDMTDVPENAELLALADEFNAVGEPHRPAPRLSNDPVNESLES